MGGNSVSRPLDSILLTPQGNVTKINKRDFWNLDEHIKPGDRIAWHRPYMLIHEAIVLQVDALKSEVLIFERTKTCSSSNNLTDDDDDGAPWGPGIGKITKVDLTTQRGQLYRYNDTHDSESLKNILKQVLMNLDTRGYNLLVLNCQTSASGVKTDGKNKSSYQTQWFAVKLAVEAGIPLFSEMLEKVCGGAEWIGIVSAGILHATAFVIELIAVLFKYKRGHMSRDDLRTVISRQLLMHVVGWFGNFLSSFKKGREFLQKTGTVPLVLSFFFAVVADALFLCAGCDPQSWWRYLPMALGGVTGFFLGFAAVGAYLEFLVSMILGFAGTFVGHGLYHAGSWLLEWLTEQFKGHYVQSVLDLQKGDHITTYERIWHRHCHAIFDECDNGKMKIIRNTYSHGIIEDVVPFQPNRVYRYEYPSEIVRSGEEVVCIAKSKLQESSKYSWTSYNCKTFAEECKLVKVSSGSNITDWEEHHNALMEDDNISEKDKKILQENFRKFQILLSEQSCYHNNMNGENIQNDMTLDNQPISVSSKKVSFGSK